MRQLCKRGTHNEPHQAKCRPIFQENCLSITRISPKAVMSIGQQSPRYRTKSGFRELPCQSRFRRVFAITLVCSFKGLLKLMALLHLLNSLSHPSSQSSSDVRQVQFTLLFTLSLLGPALWGVVIPSMCKSSTYSNFM